MLTCLLLGACSSDSNPVDDAPNEAAAINRSSLSRPQPTTEQQSAETPTVNPKKPTVIWAKPGFAPLFISEEPFKGEGTGDFIFQTLQLLLPQFNHVNTKANYTRIIAEMQKGTDLCALLFYHKAREEFAIYSDPLAITPSYQVYTSLQGKATLDQAFGRDVKQASLDELLGKSQGLTLLITPHQTYGKKRDAIIAKHRDSLTTQYHLTDQPAMMKILATNRAQMLLAMPWVFNYEQNNLGLHDRIEKITLTDVPAYQSSYLVCTKTELGRRVINTINAIEPAAHTVLRKAVADWLLPEEVEDYYQAYDAYFGATPKS